VAGPAVSSQAPSHNKDGELGDGIYPHGSLPAHLYVGGAPPHVAREQADARLLQPGPAKATHCHPFLWLGTLQCKALCASMTWPPSSHHRAHTKQPALGPEAASLYSGMHTIVGWPMVMLGFW
jgi:hypothetical protein